MIKYAYIFFNYEKEMRMMTKKEAVGRGLSPSTLGWGFSSLLIAFALCGLALGAGAAQGQGDETEVWRPGLYETLIKVSNLSTKDWTLDYSSFTEGSTYQNGVYRRELGVLPVRTSNKTSELWGDSVSWSSGQWVYWGYMYLEAGKNYKFCVGAYNYALFQLTELTTNEKTNLVDAAFRVGGRAPESSVYVPAMTGWYPVEIRMQGENLYWINENAAGYSSNGGTNWKILYDSGDGSFLRTAGPALVIKASGRVVDSKQVIDLSFASSDSPRTLAVVWGATRGGESTNAWANAQVIGTVAAGATTATYTMPDSWGGKDNLVARFCFVPSETVQPEWSNTYDWHDLTAPAFADVAADGSGGDTIKVTGKVESFTGDSCEVKVLVGTSSDSLAEWTDATATLTAAGGFTFSLCETDTSAARYIAPGSTYYVQVEATANGKTVQSEVMKVTTLAAAAWEASRTAASAARRDVTFSGSLTSVGMSADGQATVELWAGTANDESSLAKVKELKVAPSTMSAVIQYSVVHEFDNVETTYYWQFRVTSAAAGGTSNVVTRTPVKSVKTRDLTTYTWTGAANDGGVWETAANWDADPAVARLDYPQTTNATVRFAAGETVPVVLASSRSIRTISVADANASGTIRKGATSTPTLTVVEPFALSGADSVLTFDGLTVKSTSAGSSSIGAGCTLTLTNGASVAFEMYPLCVGFDNNGGILRITEGSTFTCWGYNMSNGSLTFIRDATFSMSGEWVKWNGTGTNTIQFEGETPLFKNTYRINTFAPGTANAVLNLNFNVPRSGYAMAPLQGGSGDSLGSGGKAGKAYVNVAASRSVKLQDGQTSTPLITRNNGISTSVFTAGTLPSEDSAFTGFTDGSKAVGVNIVLPAPGLILLIR